MIQNQAVSLGKQSGKHGRLLMQVYVGEASKNILDCIFRNYNLRLFLSWQG